MTHTKLFEGWQTAQEFADDNGLHVKTVYDYINRGLPHNDRLGRKLIHVETARQWLTDGMKQQPTAAA